MSDGPSDFDDFEYENGLGEYAGQKPFHDDCDIADCEREGPRTSVSQSLRSKEADYKALKAEVIKMINEGKPSFKQLKDAKNILSQKKGSQNKTL